MRPKKESQISVISNKVNKIVRLGSLKNSKIGTEVLRSLRLKIKEK